MLGLDPLTMDSYSHEYKKWMLPALPFGPVGPTFDRGFEGFKSLLSSFSGHDISYLFSFSCCHLLLRKHVYCRHWWVLCSKILATRRLLHIIRNTVLCGSEHTPKQTLINHCVYHSFCCRHTRRLECSGKGEEEGRTNGLHVQQQAGWGIRSFLPRRFQLPPSTHWGGGWEVYDQGILMEVDDVYQYKYMLSSFVLWKLRVEMGGKGKTTHY